jgi:transposase-like protein
MIFTVAVDVLTDSLVVWLWCQHQPTTREDRMGHAHPSTPAQRLQWASYLLAHAGEYGVVAALSRATGVSRPTLYSWRLQAQHALLQTFSPLPQAPVIRPAVEREVLTLWGEAHASTRGIHTCLAALTQRGISLETITRILQDAEQRALTWFEHHAPPTVRTLALDEIYANDRHGAYLNGVDAHSGAVWVSEGPVPVDSETWSLVLWELQARGVQWNRVVLDGGTAMQAACREVTPEVVLQHDQWHVLHRCAQLQARLERHVAELTTRTAVVARQAARVATGQPPKGRNPQTDLTAHAATVARATRLAADVRYLVQEIHRLLEVVVVDRRGVLDGAQRQAEVTAALTLLAEVATTAPATLQPDVQRVSSVLHDALPRLLTFVEQVAQVQHDLRPVLPAERQALLGWAWLRRKVLGWSRGELLAALPESWQGAARILLAAWDDANLARVSSAVERWHSILRPHLAVHRTLTRGRLALLAVWHNHRVFRRGVHKGTSPLHLSGLRDAPSDWLVALGYPPAEAAAAVPPPSGPLAPVLALAA